jgi:hypothetical protein
MHAFYRGQGLTLTRGRVTLDVKVAIGATGAPTIDGEISRGVASIVRNGAGDYTLTLKEAYHDFLNVKGNVIDADDPGIDWIGVIAEDVNAPAAPTLQIGCRNAGTLTELDDGATLLLEINLRYASDNG